MSKFNALNKSTRSDMYTQTCLRFKRSYIVTNRNFNELGWSRLVTIVRGCWVRLSSVSSFLGS